VVIALYALVDNKAAIGRAEFDRVENWRSEITKAVCLGHGFNNVTKQA